jgi:hypothetical protein
MENQNITSVLSTVGTGANSLENLKRNNATVTNAAGEATIVKGKKVSNTKAKKDPGAAAFGKIAGQVKSTMVTTGGTNAEPEKADAAAFPTVTMAELGTSGSVLQNLAFNMLAGTVDKSITVETLNQLPRALRNEKTAIKGLLGKKSGDIRAAWEKEQSQRKRLDSPTLRALWAAVKGKAAKGTGESWKDKVVKILDGKQSAAMKLQMLRELVDETK